MVKISVSSWEFEGYFPDMSEVKSKLAEVESACSSSDVEPPVLDIDVHGYGTRATIYADESVLNSVTPVYRSDWDYEEEL